MEKEIKTVCKKEFIKHSFYCDDCDKYLGTSEEYDDGWYHKFGEFELKFYVSDKWYRIEKCLCDDCKKSFITNVKINLINMGFEED